MIKSIFLLVTILAGSAFAAESGPATDKTVVTDNNYYSTFPEAALKKELKNLQDEQAKGQKIIDSCSKAQLSGSVTINWRNPCTSFGFSGHSVVNIPAKQQEVDALAYKIKAAQEELTKKRMAGPQAVTMSDLKFTLTAQNLLMDTQALQSRFSWDANKIEQPHKQINDTLLGEYTKYVATESVKAAMNGESNVCQAISKCDSVKKSKKELDQVMKSIDPYKKWADAQFVANAAGEKPKAPLKDPEAGAASK